MKSSFFFILIFLTSSTLFSQVGIGTTGPDPSSVLEIFSTDKGLLIPRMDSAERDAIVDPANGLIIYNTDTDEIQLNSNSPGTPIWQALDTAPINPATIGQSVKYSNTDITTDVNLATAISAPIVGSLEWNDNTTLFTANTTTHEITVNVTGRYKILVNIPLITGGTADRLTPEMRIAVDGTEVGSYGSTGYIRTNTNHQESSLHLTEILEITAGETISVNIQGTGNINNNAANDVTIRGVGGASIYIEKLM